MSAQERKSMGVMEILIVVGFAAFFGWYMLLMVGLPAEFPVDGSDFQARLIQFAGLLGLVLGMSVIAHDPKSYESKAFSSPMFIVWTILGCIAPIAVCLNSFNVDLPFAAYIIVYLVSGFTAAYFYAGWDSFAATNRIRDNLAMVGNVMILGILLCLVVILLMREPARSIMTIMLLILCTVMFFQVNSKRYGKKGRQSKDQDEVAEATESLKDFFNTRLSALLLIVNVPLGFALPLIYTENLYLTFAPLIAAMIALVIFRFFCGYAVRLTFINLLKVVASIAIVSLALIIANNGAEYVAIPLLVMVWLVFRVAHNGTMLGLTSIQKVDSVYLLVRGKVPGYTGFTLGFLIGMFAIFFKFSQYAFMYMGLGLIVLVALGMFILIPSTEKYSHQLAMTEEELRGPQPDASDKERCALLAKRFGLSAREEEVLYYILKGRNARYIAETLVISESTAKTHIHNIYKKSGVHSQQKFIDLLDELS